MSQPTSSPEWIVPSWGSLPTSENRPDSRLITEGALIPSQYYADQPYLVETEDGAWLCVLTTGETHEGGRGQHIVSLRSMDHGKTWSEPVMIEPPEGPEASWAVPLAAPNGRIFVFYVYNADDIRELPMEDGSMTTRMDSHGHYVFRWSDDHGRSWNSPRVFIPVREFEIDRKHPRAGQVRLFWNTGRPIVSQGSVVLPLHKVGGFGEGWFTCSEGALVRSEDLLTLADPSQATWQTLPEGDVGLRAPLGGGPVAEEQSLVELSDGSFLAVYRTIDGYPVGAYSRDRGDHWQEPRYLQYRNGRRLKHPRAACFIWKLKAGHYVLWFHNHGGAMLGTHPKRQGFAYSDRNPVWMSRGSEIQTERGIEVVWEEPEIVLYDDDPTVRMSYPDLREVGEVIYLTETQKAVARMHQLGAPLAQALREGASAFDAKAIREAAIVELSPNSGSPQLPRLPSFLGLNPNSPYGLTDQRAGFSIECELDVSRLTNSTRLLDAWHESFGGLRLDWQLDGRIRLTCGDGQTEISWSSDLHQLKGTHHMVIRVDGGPKIISFLIDGILNDGGDDRRFGWGRFSPHFRGLPEKMPIHFTVAGKDSIRSLRIYPRVLLAAEVSALYPFSQSRVKGLA